MKKNLYYAAVFKRQNIIKYAILGFFLAIASYPRLLLEVFLRKDMGERYFNLASALTVAVIYGVVPSLGMVTGGMGYSLETYIQWNPVYYLFLLVFVGFSVVRYLEIRRLPSVFDFGRMSGYSGRVHPFFYTIRLFGKEPSIRTIEIWYEPAPFLIGGILFLLTGFSTPLGLVLISTSIIYSLSHSGAYAMGDNFIMDRIDEIIANQDLTQAFVNDEESPRGFRWYGRKPSSKQMREEYVEDIAFEEVKDDTSVK